jgi:Haem-binding domain
VNHSGVPREPPENSRVQAGEDVKTATATRPRWPPQSYVAPFSWLLARDVEQGREVLNFSTWDEDEGEADDAADAVADVEMPPRRYLLVHPDAALSDAERQVLVQALTALDRDRGEDRSGPGG